MGLMVVKVVVSLVEVDVEVPLVVVVSVVM